MHSRLKATFLFLFSFLLFSFLCSCAGLDEQKIVGFCEKPSARDYNYSSLLIVINDATSGNSSLATCLCDAIFLVSPLIYQVCEHRDTRDVRIL